MRTRPDGDSGIAPQPLPVLSTSSPGDARTGRTERADARRNRDKILCAARALVQEVGVEGLSMDEVALRADVGKGTLYRRFEDRAGLLYALIHESERLFQEALLRGEPPLGPGAPPLERLRAFGAALIDHLEQNGAVISEGERSYSQRLIHPVYAVYHVHVSLLMVELLGPAPRTEYFVDALLAPLSARTYMQMRTKRGLGTEQIAACWLELLEALVD